MMYLSDPFQILISLPIALALGFSVAFIFTFAVYNDISFYKGVFPEPKEFRVSGHGAPAGGMAFVNSGGASSMATNPKRSTVYLLHPESKGFAAVLEKHGAKGTEIQSAMSRRPIEHQRDFAQIEADGFKGYEYLVDYSLIDFSAMRFFTSRDA